MSIDQKPSASLMATHIGLLIRINGNGVEVEHLLFEISESVVGGV